jgi:hypothetical protein
MSHSQKQNYNIINSSSVGLPNLLRRKACFMACSRTRVKRWFRNSVGSSDLLRSCRKHRHILMRNLCCGIENPRLRVPLFETYLGHLNLWNPVDNIDPRYGQLPALFSELRVKGHRPMTLRRSRTTRGLINTNEFRSIFSVVVKADTIALLRYTAILFLYNLTTNCEG